MKFCRFDYAAFLLFMSYAVCSLLVPVVLVEIADDLDFKLTEGGMSSGGVLQMFRSIPMVLAMFACSMLGNKFGIRRSLVIAAVFMSMGIMLAAVSNWYWMLLTVLIIAGLGEGLIEGLATPFVGVLHKNEEPGRYINFSHGFWSVGIFICVPLLAWLSAENVSWRILCLIAGIIALTPAVILCRRGKRAISSIEGYGRFDAALAWRNAWTILCKRKFWLFFTAMFFAGGGEFGITFWSASLLRIEYNQSAFIGGIGTAAFSAGMMLGRAGCGLCFRQYHLPVVVMVSGIAGSVLTSFFSFVDGTVWVIVLLFFAGLASFSFWPCVQSYCVDRLEDLDSTTLYILLSCAGVPGCGFFSMFMGKIGDMWGLRAAFLVVPICYLLLAFLIGWDYFICNGRKNMSSLRLKSL